MTFTASGWKPGHRGRRGRRADLRRSCRTYGGRPISPSYGSCEILALVLDVAAHRTSSATTPTGPPESTTGPDYTLRAVPAVRSDGGSDGRRTVYAQRVERSMAIVRGRLRAGGPAAQPGSSRTCDMEDAGLDNDFETDGGQPHLRGARRLRPLSGPRLITLPAAMAAAVVALLGLATPALATFPGTNGPILFARGPGPMSPVCSDDIWSMQPDGSGQMQITNSPECESGPAVSPNGNLIAFARGNGAARERQEFPGENSRKTGKNVFVGAQAEPVFRPSGGLAGLGAGRQELPVHSNGGSCRPSEYPFNPDFPTPWTVPTVTDTGDRSCVLAAIGDAVAYTKREFFERTRTSSSTSWCRTSRLRFSELDARPG